MPNNFYFSNNWNENKLMKLSIACFRRRRRLRRMTTAIDYY